MSDAHPSDLVMIATDLTLPPGRFNQITLAGVAVRLWLIATAALAVAVL